MSLQSPISSYMSPHPVSLRPQASSEEARRIFADNGFTIAPVVDDEGNLVGVVTASDLLASDDDDSLLAGAVADFMSTDVATVSTHADVAEVARALTDLDLHHAVVTELDGKPVGIVSNLDIAAAAADAGLDAPVSTLMSELLVFIESDDLVEEARERLEDAEISAAAVVDADGTLVGAVTQLALLRADDPEARVDDVIEREVLCVEDDTPASDVAVIFAREGVRRVFVLDDSGDAVGVVTATDMVRYVAGLFEESGIDGSGPE
jgi:CBS domain-containing protein